MDVTYLEDFHDDTDSEREDDIVEPRPKRRRLANRNWVKEEEFASAEEATKSLGVTWKKSSTKTIRPLVAELNTDVLKEHIESMNVRQDCSSYTTPTVCLYLYIVPIVDMCYRDRRTN